MISSHFSRSTKKGLFISTCVLSLAVLGCEPRVFGVPEKEWQQMNPTQQQMQIQRYNAEQQRAAEEKPLWDSLGAIVGAVENSPKVQDGTTHEHCTSNTPPPVCQKNPDGSVHCTQQASSSCSSFGL
jgi:hypothetical protein